MSIQPGQPATPPQAPAVAPQPAPQTPPQAARPAPPSGVDAAHKVLDTKVSDLVKQFAPDQAGSVPAFIGDKTLRQAIQTPMIGGQVRSQLTPYLSKLGLNPQDFEKAVNSPPAAPGKRSEGTSDATDFCAQSRTPPGTPENVPLPQPGPRTENRNDAQVDLNMTPQERALYDRHLGNLYGSGGVDNPNGSRSTLYQANVDIDGKSYNIPTVYDGKIVPVDEAVARAKAQGLDKFPSYATPDAAEARYGQMHDYMDKDTGAYFKGRQPGPPAPGPGELPTQLPGAVRPVDVPKGPQPTITPEMMKAIENAVKDQGRPPGLQAPPPGALPVPPAETGPPMPGLPGAAPGAPGVGPGVSLPAPVSPLMVTPGSQGNPIAMAGVAPEMPNALQPPIPYSDMQGWGWNTGSTAPAWGGWSLGGFDGGLGGFSGGE
jgi:hypothetical protein